MELDETAAVGQHIDSFLPNAKVYGYRTFCNLTQSFGVSQCSDAPSGLTRYYHMLESVHAALQEQAQNPMCRAFTAFTPDDQVILCLTGLFWLTPNVPHTNT